MSELRLYIGATVIVVQTPGRWDNHIATHIGWHISEDEARGAFVKGALQNQQTGRLDSVTAHDITDFAKERRA